MKTRYLVLILGVILVACSTSSEVLQTQSPEPTSLLEPTATSTVQVETEVPPSAIPTDTPQPTPTQVPTDTPQPIQFNFSWYENNPVLSKGGSGEWDYIRVLEGKILLIDEVFHMFYTGLDARTAAIGYAVSTDGLTFTKHDANPIFQSDGEGFDAIGVSNGTPLMVGDTWMLFYNANAADERYRPVTAGGSSIGLTTAPEPTGPWTPGQQVLMTGGSGEWDSGYIFPTTVLATEDGYRMYYSGGPDPGKYNMMCGMATSPDGINWTKYDDPTTTDAPFAESDPVMLPGPSGWESVLVNCKVRKTDRGWEMIYEGWDARSVALVGYASSPDGITWTKFQGNPILKRNLISAFIIEVDSTYYLYGQDFRSGNLIAATGTIDYP